MSNLTTTTVLLMVKDEIDIIEAWIDHTDQLFDSIFVVDHGSKDGTYEFLKRREQCRPGMSVLRYLEPRFAKDEILDLLRWHAIDTTNADWFFYLDPDEFLPFASRLELTERLEKSTDAGVVKFLWRNCYLAAPKFDRHALYGYRQNRVSKIGKVAIHRSLAADPCFQVPIGAHNVQHQTLGTISGEVVGELYHFPIRSPDQLFQKLLNGTANRLRLLRFDSKSRSHWHYPAMLNVITNKPEWRNVSSLVWDYGEDQPSRPTLVPTAEFEPWTFRFAGEIGGGDRFEKIETSVGELPLLTALMNERNASLLNEVIELNTPPVVEIPDVLRRVNQDLIAQKSNYDCLNFASLESVGSAKPLTYSDLMTALQSAFSQIMHPVHSAWGEHIPFMFSLIALLKPRRYAELGVHNGASFFAACQAVESCGLSTDCIAIDNWVGDTHAGFHNANVFDTFVSTIRKFDKFAGYIRANFNQAVERFQDGSIDLLHVDGLHTATAVRSDFETWLPKLSDRGVIMFHDINEFRSDFGVWRFWRDVRDKYPHFEFGHGHGLGVLLVGENCALRLPIEGCVTPFASPSTNELLQVIYGGVGHLAWTDARQAPKSPPTSTQAKSTDTQAKIRELQNKLNAVLNSTSWKITAPMRAVVAKLLRR